MTKFITIILLMGVFILNGWAGVTGKIAGVVVDKQSREPLPGVNVFIQGTMMGSSTDVDGYYGILNIPPGVYKLEATYVGYSKVEILEVKVYVDLTTNINIEMAETTLELNEVITVISERPLIRSDEVSTRQYVSTEEIEIRPVDSFQEIAQQQAGVVGTHFRGGRSGEVLVMVDGIPMRDPAATYAGDMGGFTSDVVELGIQEMEVTLGGFSAEYGNVQSGILNLALQEGRPDYSGRVRFTSNNFGTSAINTYTTQNSFQMLGEADSLNWQKENRLMNYIYEFNLSGPEPITSSLLPRAGIRIPGAMTFSFSTEITDNRSGYFINQNSFDQTYQGKLTYRISPQFKISYGTIYNKSEYDTYYYQASKFGPAPNYPVNELKFIQGNTDTLAHYVYVDDPSPWHGIPVVNTLAQTDSFGGAPYNVIKTYYVAGMQEYLWDLERKSNTNYVIWTHTLSPKSYYEVRLNYFYTNYHYAGRDVEDRNFNGDTQEELVWDPDLPGAHPIYRERENNYWWIRGDDPGFQDQKSWVYSLKGDLVSQITAKHMIKGGLEFYAYRTKVENISWTLGYGTFRTDIWDKRSMDFGVYMQDKMEFAGLIGLIGFRFDYFDPGKVPYPSNYENPYSSFDEEGVPVLNDPVYSEPQSQISPRIGISHPISSRDVLHFTYGHYFQRPDGYFLYRNYQMGSLTKVGNYIGNPGLLPEKTVSYEIGVEHLFTDYIKATVSGYYKDVTNLMNWRKYVGRSIQNIELNVFTNADYGNIKGLEFTLVKRPGRFWGASANYTFSVAKGRSSSYASGSGSFTDVKRMNILDFDQTHTVNANITLQTPKAFGPGIGSFKPFEMWIANIQFAYGSGLPYSSYGTGLINDQRMPETTMTDLRLIRSFLIKPVTLDLFLDIFNLFNNRNVNFIGSSQYYGMTGDPAIIGLDNISGDYIRHPQTYSMDRQFRFGLTVKF